MKKFVYFWMGFVCSVLIFISVGCFSLPSLKQASAEKKTAKIEQQIDKNSDSALEKIKNYSYAANYSLSLDPSPNKFSEVASDMTSKALIVSGPPTMKESSEFKSIVKGLVSTNDIEVMKAQKALDIKDAEVVRLQGELVILNTKLDKQQEKNTELAKANASLGDFLARIKHWLFWGMIIVGILIAIHVLSVILPPPYNQPFHLVSLIFGLLGKAVAKFAPKAMEFASVVPKKAFDKSEHALQQVVTAVEEAREDPSLKQKLDPILLDKTDSDTSRPKIEEIKKSLNL